LLYDERRFSPLLWKFKKFDTLNLRTSNNEEVTVANGSVFRVGRPDFFNAQITIGNQMWAGNVEIH
jgi:hypothetical protein